MKIVSARPGVNATGHLVLSVDVSKQYLDCYVRLSDTYRRIPNSTPAVETHLSSLISFADREQLAGVLVACEPSGGYERTLLDTARRTGCQCVYVSGEQVAQLRKIESLDTGKTDVKDPRVIELAVRLGKEQRYRQLPPLYEELRLLTAACDADEQSRTRTKQRIVTTAIGLFPGYDIGKERFFSRTGRAVIDVFSLDPSAIVRAGRLRFGRRLRARVPGIHTATLDKIYAQAEAAGSRLDGATAILKNRIKDLMGDVERYDARIARSDRASSRAVERCKTTGFFAGSTARSVDLRFTTWRASQARQVPFRTFIRSGRSFATPDSISGSDRAVSIEVKRGSPRRAASCFVNLWRRRPFHCSDMTGSLGPSTSESAPRACVRRKPKSP